MTTLSVSQKSSTRSGARIHPAIGGEFALDPLALARLPDEAGWRGVPDWEAPQSTYVASGRMAMLLGLRAVEARPSDIWVPEYICESVVRTLQRAGWRPRAYPLRDDLSADLGAWRRLWNGGPAACVLMHYFGIPQPPAVWEFLAERRVRPVVEDRTHSLWNLSPRKGDVVFASLRKWFALPDGGVVRVSAAHGSPTLSGSDEPWVRGRLMALTARHTFLTEPSGDNTSEPYFLEMIERSERRLDRDEEIRKISTLSWRILQTQAIPDLITRRRSNYERLATALKGHPRVRPVYPSLPPGACPLGFPVVCDGREELRVRLKTERIYCAVHWPMEGWSSDWPTPHARDFGRRLLALNIDQRMASEDIDRLAESVWSYGV